MKFFNALTQEWVTTAEWQDALAVGDHYIIEYPDFTVYGHITETTPNEGFFFVQGYSFMCPAGEGGIVCIADVSRQITEEEFTAAKQRGWQ